MKSVENQSNISRKSRENQQKSKRRSREDRTCHAMTVLLLSMIPALLAPPLSNVIVTFPPCTAQHYITFLCWILVFCRLYYLHSTACWVPATCPALRVMLGEDWNRVNRIWTQNSSLSMQNSSFFNAKLIIFNEKIIIFNTHLGCSCRLVHRPHRWPRTSR